MRFLAYFRSFAAKFFRASQTEVELDDELRSHIELRVDDLEQSGLSRIEALKRAKIEFGGKERFKEESRGVRDIEVEVKRPGAPPSSPQTGR